MESDLDRCYRWRRAAATPLFTGKATGDWFQSQDLVLVRRWYITEPHTRTVVVSLCQNFESFLSVSDGEQNRKVLSEDLERGLCTPESQPPLFSSIVYMPIHIHGCCQKHGNCSWTILGDIIRRPWEPGCQLRVSVGRWEGVRRKPIHTARASFSDSISTPRQTDGRIKQLWS
jgi:hypothetical protein